MEINRRRLILVTGCLSICIDELRKTTKILGFRKRFPERDLNSGPPEYSVDVVTAVR